MSQAAALPAAEAVPPRLRHALFALLGVVGVTTIAGTAFSPYLLVKAPLLLVALAPEGRHIILAVSTTDPVLLVAVATLRRLLGLIAAYGLGLTYGPAAVSWVERRFPRFGKLVRIAERLFARVGAPLLLFIPLQSIALLAGAARTRFFTFLGFVSVGQFCMVLITYLFGDAITKWTEPILVFLSEHVVETTIACATLVALQQGVAYYRKRRGAPELGVGE
ncbi:MAG: hypothetical protein KF718_33630 [Polyangiaceae bacterium]|nr:hypothetical protein [Polyangiaceae bacterium]